MQLFTHLTPLTKIARSAHVFPAQAGIQEFAGQVVVYKLYNAARFLDPRLRGEHAVLSF